MGYRPSFDFVKLFIKYIFKSKTVKLNSGYEMPVLGLGTWLHKYDFENQMGDAVVYAIKKGYRVSEILL